MYTSDMSNVYSQPEKFGLRQIAFIEEELGYEFNMLVAWIDESGRIYWASDAGCSCPEPFENFQDIGDLHMLSDANRPR